MLDYSSLFYRMYEQYGVKINIVRQSVSNIDFATGSQITSVDSTVARALALPEKVCAEFYKNTQTITEKYEKVFIIQCKDVKPSSKNYILLGENRFNIKEVIVLDKTYYMITTTAHVGELNDQSQLD